jgi:Family of unknown function (DUF5996)
VLSFWGIAIMVANPSSDRSLPAPLPDFTADPALWPALPPLEAWADTCDTLHMWTQIVGKVRLALSPLLNHWWEVALYISPRGLTTSAIPYDRGSLRLNLISSSTN